MKAVNVPQQGNQVSTINYQRLIRPQNGIVAPNRINKTMTAGTGLWFEDPRTRSLSFSAPTKSFGMYFSKRI